MSDEETIEKTTETIENIKQTFSIEFDSQYRNKHTHPNPYNFTINYSDSINTIQRVNPTSGAFPIKEWSWNSHPPVTVIQGLDEQPNEPNAVFPFADYTRGITNNISFLYRVDAESEGKGMLIYIDSTISSGDGTVVVGSDSVKIFAYGNNYVEGETLKINRSEVFYNYQNFLSNTNSMFFREVNFQGTESFYSTQSISNGIMPNPSKLRSFYLQPVIIEQTFNTIPPGYFYDTSSDTPPIYDTTGGSGTGLKVFVFYTTHKNDVSLYVKNAQTTISTYTASGYKEGDIITVLDSGGVSGSIKCMLVDIRIRIGESYSLDVSNIINGNIIQDETTGVIYNHANLNPLHRVQTKTGKGSGMILGTLSIPTGDLNNANWSPSDNYIINKIVCIYEAGKDYKPGDIVTVTDRSNNSFDLVVTEPHTSKSSKYNIKQIYDNGFLTGDKHLEPQLYDKKLKMGDYIHASKIGSYSRSSTTITIIKNSHGLVVDDIVTIKFFTLDTSNIEGTMPSNRTPGGATDGTYNVASVVDANTFTVTDSVSGTINAQSEIETALGESISQTYEGYPCIVESDNDLFDLYNTESNITNTYNSRRYNSVTNRQEIENFSSLNNIIGNKVHLNNSRFFGLGVYDNFYKGLFFENLTVGTKHRITEYNHKDCVLRLEDNIKDENMNNKNFWKIENPSTSDKIFVPDGSDNPKEYIGNVYEAVIHTGQVNAPKDFFVSKNVTVNNVPLTQYKLNNIAFDTKICHQFRNITDYDPVSKMITLDTPLVGITSHANQYNKTSPISINNIRYIHYSSQTYQDGEYTLQVFPFEYDNYGEDLSLSPTNTNASGLTITIIISNGRIESIGDIEIVSAGSGYESNVASLGITSSTTYHTNQHTIGYNYTNWTNSYSS